MAMPGKEANYGKPWSRKELILAFDLYCRIPFQRTKASNPDVQKLATILDRSPASVARKLGNFGAFDPELKKLNISGLQHGSRLDLEIWEEFHKDWNVLVLEASKLRTSFNETPPEKSLEIPFGPSERVATAKQRIHQSFFRDAVLSSYENRCCITGISLPECLIASHIVPWSADERFRADPTNGLCLSSTFDRLFDAGLITVTDDLVVRLSQRLLGMTKGPVHELICRYHEHSIFPPMRFAPEMARLRWHRENVFIG